MSTLEELIIPVNHRTNKQLKYLYKCCQTLYSWFRFFSLSIVILLFILSTQNIRTCGIDVTFEGNYHVAASRNNIHLSVFLIQSWVYIIIQDK